jgi:hypothetical protein
MNTVFKIPADSDLLHIASYQTGEFGKPVPRQLVLKHDVDLWLSHNLTEAVTTFSAYVTKQNIWDQKIKEPEEYVLDFVSKSDAMLFKLTWIGRG